MGGYGTEGDRHAPGNNTGSRKRRQQFLGRSCISQNRLPFATSRSEQQHPHPPPPPSSSWSSMKPGLPTFSDAATLDLSFFPHRVSCPAPFTNTPLEQCDCGGHRGAPAPRALVGSGQTTDLPPGNEPARRARCAVRGEYSLPSKTPQSRGSLSQAFGSDSSCISPHRTGTQRGHQQGASEDPGWEAAAIVGQSAARGRRLWPQRAPWPFRLGEGAGAADGYRVSSGLGQSKMLKTTWP